MVHILIQLILTGQRPASEICSNFNYCVARSPLTAAIPSFPSPQGRHLHYRKQQNTPMTGLSDTVNSDENPPLAELRRLKSQAQSGERRRQLRREAQKIESKKPNPSDPEPQEAEMAKPQRKKKRNFFKWLLTPSVATNRQVAPPRVRVKIPIVYRNGEHKGVVVGGVRVPFSRPMQANRRRLLLSRDDVSSVIPEDTEFVLEFPPRLAREEFETEHKRKEQEKNKLKYEKLAKELAK